MFLVTQRLAAQPRIPVQRLNQQGGTCRELVARYSNHYRRSKKGARPTEESQVGSQKPSTVLNDQFLVELPNEQIHELPQPIELDIHLHEQGKDPSTGGKTGQEESGEGSLSFEVEKGNYSV